MGEVSIRRALLPSVAALAVMVAAALVTSRLSGIDGTVLVPAYLIPAFCVAIAAVPIWAASELLVLAVRGTRRPGTVIWGRLRAASPMLALPIVVQPLFLAAFTTAKTAMAPLASFSWDGRFAMLDHMIFGMDPWRLTFDLIGVDESRMLELFYTAGWGLSLAFIQVFVVLMTSRRFAGRFFLAMNLSWGLGGIALAYLTPAAGPIFAHLFEPSLAGRFDGLRSLLGDHLAATGPILRTQSYLVMALGTRAVEIGGGISAMPSVHVEVAMLYVFAAQGSRWSIPSIAFAVLTFIGSVHFGYHYAVDGFAAAGVAAICWKVSTVLFHGRAANAFSLPALPFPIARGPKPANEAPG